MTLQNRSLAAVALLLAMPAGAVQTPQYDVPYVGGATSVLGPDSVRRSDAVGGGYQLMGGYPLSGNSAVEVRLIDHEMRRQVDDSANFQTSLFAEYVYDFGSSVKGEGGFFSGTKFFVMAGLGAVQEDSYGEKGTYAAVDIGAGALIPLGFKGWAIRLDGRLQVENNKDLCDERAVSFGQCEDEASFLIDNTLAASLQIPLTIFFKRTVLPEVPEECPLAVVDPLTGRRDCKTDSDGDGVADEADQCPRTTQGANVDPTGCPVTVR